MLSRLDTSLSPTSVHCVSYPRSFPGSPRQRNRYVSSHAALVGSCRSPSSPIGLSPPCFPVSCVARDGVGLIGMSSSPFSPNLLPSGVCLLAESGNGGSSGEMEKGENPKRKNTKSQARRERRTLVKAGDMLVLHTWGAVWSYMRDSPASPPPVPPWPLVTLHGLKFIYFARVRVLCPCRRRRFGNGAGPGRPWWKTIKR